MKIIMLAGKGNKGKTKTLKMVYDRLSNNIKPIHYQEFKHPITDIECYPLYHHDKKVALYTEGDEWIYIKDAIIKFNCIGADVLIISFSEDEIKKEAAKNKDIREDLFMEIFKPDNLKDIQPHFVIQKRVSPDPKNSKTNEENNEKDCQAIIDRITR